MALVIAIPSYKRHLNLKTLAYLKKEQIPIEFITIFVANETELELYKAEYPKYTFVVGEIGIKNQRNFISKYYDDGIFVISMDDDIIDLVSFTNKPFLIWAKECIKYMEDHNLGLLGINPTTNLYWVQNSKAPEFQKGRYLSVGVFHIYKNYKDENLTINCIEDYERSIISLRKYGSVARYNGVGLKTKYWAAGGLRDERTIELYKSQVYKFFEIYPTEVKITMKKISQLSKIELLPNIVIIKKVKNEKKD